MPEPTTPLVERPWEDVERMLDVDSALERVLSAFSPLQPVMLPLLDAANMVLAADVIAVNDVPPFRNSAMDGYAVRAADTLSATWSGQGARGRWAARCSPAWRRRGHPDHDRGAATGGSRRGSALRGN
jgi:hypothetical protein